MSEPMWIPDTERVAKANLTRFITQVRARRPEVRDYSSLYQWSIDHPMEFWPEVWSFGGILGSRLGSTVVKDFEKMPGAKWFPEAQLNFAENLLRHKDDREALVFWNEEGRQGSLTFTELYRQVSQTAAAMRSAGVTVGDRVAGFLPNIPEAVVAMLAVASMGAIWSSTSPDFGPQGVLDRFGQIEPKMLFAADGYLYNGKRIDCRERVAALVSQVPSIEKTVMVSYLDSRADFSAIPGAVRFEDFIASQPGELLFEQLPFDHPLYILYSSGTTGPPKCIVHGAGGTLIQHLKEHLLHTDLGERDRFFYFTTCGWMMWNWLVSGLACGATVILYEGSSLAKNSRILWDLAEQERVTVFGVSAKYLALIEKAGLEPRKTHDLKSLRILLSAGSPLTPDSYDFVYEKIKGDVCLSSVSGGTDIVSCFAAGNPIGPVYRGELQTLGLGMKVEVFNEAGQPVQGEKGELVCSAAFPSMPICFWNDPDNSKYHSSYFNRYPNVWRQGDWAELTSNGGMIIFGRSDAVLNPGGVRIGTAEIYRQVEQLDEILESIVVGQDWQGDVRIILFVKLQPEVTLDQALGEKIKSRIRANTTPRHVPQKILQVADIPRTISGKIVELAVRDVIHGRPVKNQDALANPAALELFKNLKELQEP
ncbi:MAG: acetoacetate--CoA ligase [Gemmataceae bacterium]|nr:acetoacetate--CoA ligase [Gemmataceae bacterium]